MTKRIFWLGLALATALIVPGCGAQKGAAEKALAATVQAYDAIKQQAQNIVPDEAKAIEDGISAASAQLQGGDTKGAMTAVTALDARVKELAASLPEKTQQAQTAWAELAGSIPATFKTLDKKAAGLVKPAAGTPNAEQSAVSRLASLKTTWDEAQAAAQAGRLAEAVTKGNDVRDGTVKLLTDLQGGS
ncbi:MAG TPA: hypothetical protein VN896_08305 [Methylomirabilota bacterium]|jgi:hypothetical protein|nr:hypothetical protein [Methylomirabilota bacterium]